jgi:hypothetical protein
MSFHRFSLLKRQLRIEDPDTIEVDVPGPYHKVNEWANVIMDAALSIVSVGSIVTVDEAMQAFQGRSKQKVTIKGKPTPTGLKIWVLAVAGYVLHDIIANSRKLSDLEEHTIVQYILDLDSQGFSPRLRGVEDMANRLLAEPPVGTHWASNFVKRQPELRTRFFRR